MKQEIEKLVTAYIKCRDSLDGVRKNFKKMEAEHRADLDKIGSRIMQMCDALGVRSFAVEGVGTAFKETTTFVNVEDWNEVIEFVKKNDMYHMFQKRVNKVAVVEYMDQHANVVPPGLSFGQKVEIKVRRT